MSTATNHRRRSHRSESAKAAVYRASTRRMYYRTSRERKNRNFFARLAGAFRRSILAHSMFRIGAGRARKEDTQI